MLIFDELRDATDSAVEDRLELPFEARQKARQKVRLLSGCEAGLKLPRGSVLRGGQVLSGEHGRRVEVVAAPEPVSTVRTSDAEQLARAAYHLGNRHVWVQVGDGWLRYLHDHVLDAMLVGLGLTVVAESAPFEPESGAYADHGAHGHSHDHGH